MPVATLKRNATTDPKEPDAQAAEAARSGAASRTAALNADMRALRRAIKAAQALSPESFRLLKAKINKLG